MATAHAQSPRGTAGSATTVPPPCFAARSPRAAADRALAAVAQRLNAAPGIAALHGTAAQLRGRSDAGSATPSAGRLPATLRAGVESLSGVSMAGVRVFRNSAQPAQLSAEAYARGRDIHLAPGKDRHLPHEAWHIAQQAQGRVAATAQLKADTAINDDASLEREADVMGAKAAGGAAMADATASEEELAATDTGIVQGVFDATGLAGHPKAQQAYTLFLAAVPDGSATAALRDSTYITVNFVIANDNPKAAAHTHTRAALPGGYGDVDYGNGKAYKYISMMRNSDTVVTVNLMQHWIDLGSISVNSVAKTIAHEVGTHVAPHIAVFHSAHSATGVTDPEIHNITLHQQNEAALDHKHIRDRTDLNYEGIVQKLAVNLGGAEDPDACEVVTEYLKDISRYDAAGNAVHDSAARQARIKANLALPDLAWAKPYYRPAAVATVNAPALYARLRYLVPVLVVLLALWFGAQRAFTAQRD